MVVSSVDYGRERRDVVLMADTSQLRPSPTFGEVWLTDWQSEGLLKPSAVKPIMATLELGLILRQIGRLTNGDQAALHTAIGQIFG